MNIQSYSWSRRASALALALIASSVLAAPTGAGFVLQGAVIASGGIARATSACFDLAGTIGEPTAGVATANAIVLVSGFWAAPVAHPDELFRSSFESCAP